jgi:ribA/ribD-fused uncharacterized protein
MMCGGRKTHCVLDTGADLCVVSSLLVEDGSTDVITYPSKVKLCVLADGDSIPVLGETVMTCQLGSETYRLRFIVIDNKDTSQIILGCDFLKGVNAMIDFRQGKVFIDKSTKIEYQNELAKLENGNITCPTSGVNIVHSGYIGGYCIQHPKSYKDALLTNLAPVKTKSVDVPRLPKSHARVHVTSSESWTTLDQPPVTSRNVTFATMKNPPRIVCLKHARNMQLNNKGQVVGSATPIKPEYYVRMKSQAYNAGNQNKYSTSNVSNRHHNRKSGYVTNDTYKPERYAIAAARAANSRRPRVNTIRTVKHSSSFNMDLPSYKSPGDSSLTPLAEETSSQPAHNAAEGDEGTSGNGKLYGNEDYVPNSHTTRKAPKPHISWGDEKVTHVDLSPTTGFPKHKPPSYSQLDYNQPPCAVTHSNVPKMAMNADTVNYKSKLDEQEKIVKNVQYLKDFDPCIPNVPPKYKYFFTKETCFSNFYTRKEGPLFAAPAFIDGEFVDHPYESAEAAYHHYKALYAGRIDIAQQVLYLPPAKAKYLTQPHSMQINLERWHRDGPTLMKEVLYHKFSQNADLKEYLQNTAGHFLAEMSKSDRFWGTGVSLAEATAKQPSHPSRWGAEDGRAAINVLGTLLTQLREFFRSERYELPSVDLSLLRNHCQDDSDMVKLIFPNGIPSGKTEKPLKQSRKSPPPANIVTRPHANYETQLLGHNALEKIAIVDAKRAAINEFRNAVGPLNLGNMAIYADDYYMCKDNYKNIPGDILLLPGNSICTFGGSLRHMLDSVYNIDSNKYINTTLRGHSSQTTIPMGAAIIIPVPKLIGTIRYFVYSPSMNKPAINVSKSTNSLVCLTAALQCIVEFNVRNPDLPLKHLVTPLIATGIGRMPLDRSAKQMTTAISNYVILHNPALSLPSNVPQGNNEKFHHVMAAVRQRIDEINEKSLIQNIEENHQHPPPPEFDRPPKNKNAITSHRERLYDIKERNSNNYGNNHAPLSHNSESFNPNNKPISQAHGTTLPQGKHIKSCIQSATHEYTHPTQERRRQYPQDERYSTYNNRATSGDEKTFLRGADPAQHAEEKNKK